MVESQVKDGCRFGGIRGVSMTAVDKDLLRKQLEAERPKEDPDAKAKRLIAWVRRLDKGRKETGVTSDHSWLYDEDGLPH